MLFLPWENLARGGILCKEASLPKGFFFKVGVEVWEVGWGGQVEHSLMEQREESWLLHLSGVWSVGYFPPSFLYFFSISGTKLIKIMCSKIIFGLRLTNWYKFQSDSDRSFHFAKSAKRGVCVYVCVLCVCWEVYCKLKCDHRRRGVGQKMLCIQTTPGMNKHFRTSQSVNRKFFHVSSCFWAKALPLFPTWESL